MTIRQGGETEDQAEVFGRIIAALGVAILLMYLILVIQFGSFLDPLAIMVSLPLSLIGVMLALLVTGSTLNLMSLIGVILLMGIVAKNAILLIDFAKWAEESGHAAARGAHRGRPRPAAPDPDDDLRAHRRHDAGRASAPAKGADFRAPLGRAVIGGVITSTLLTLLVIPTFYEIMTDWRDWLGARLLGRSPQPHGSHVPADGTAHARSTVQKPVTRTT